MNTKANATRKALVQLRNELRETPDASFGNIIDEFLHYAEDEALARFHDIITSSPTKADALKSLTG